MNSKIFLFGTMILFPLIILFSCEQKKEIAENIVQFDTISITKVYHLKNDSTQPSCNLKIRFIYPSGYDNDEVLKLLQKDFISNYFDDIYKDMSPQEAIEKYAENYVNNYKEDAKIFFKEKENDYSEDSNLDTYFSYYEKLSNEIIFNKASLISYRINQTNFKGGSSSFRQFANFVYDLKKEKALLEDDIFNEGYEKALNVIFKNKLLEINKIATVNDLEDLGYFGIEEIMPNNNFLIDETGITYTFNKGEYSALQLDEINIFIPYSEIKPLLKEKSPVSAFLD